MKVTFAQPSSSCSSATFLCMLRPCTSVLSSRCFALCTAAPQLRHGITIECYGMLPSELHPLIGGDLVTTPESGATVPFLFIPYREGQPEKWMHALR